MRLGMGRGTKTRFETVCLGIITGLLLLSAFNVIQLH
jgi:hypothetical protein